MLLFGLARLWVLLRMLAKVLLLTRANVHVNWYSDCKMRSVMNWRVLMVANLLELTVGSGLKGVVGDPR